MTITYDEQTEVLLCPDDQKLEDAYDEPASANHHDAATSTARVCVMCGADLAGHRSDALTCGPPCRVERNRFLRILSGSSPGPYYSIAQRLEANAKRTKGLLRALPGHRHEQQRRRPS